MLRSSPHIESDRYSILHSPQTINILLYILLSLFFVNFAGKSNFIAAAIVGITTSRLLNRNSPYEIKLPPVFVASLMFFLLFLAMFMVSATGFNYKRIVSIMIGGTGTLLAGYLLQYNSDDPYRPIKLLFVAALPMAGFFLYSVVKTIQIYGVGKIVEVTGGRYIYYPWTKSFLNGTNMTAYAALCLAFIGILLHSPRNTTEFRIKSTMSIMAIVCFIGTTFIGSRTSIGIVLTSLLIAFFIFTKRKQQNNVFLFSIFMLILYGLYSLNIFGINSYIQNTYIYERFDVEAILEDGRISRWKNDIGLFRANPFGIGYIRVHSFWLQVAVVGGIFTFSVLICFVALSIIILWRFIQQPTILPIGKFAFAASLTTCLILMSAEPTIEGYSFMLAVYCYLIGIMVATDFQLKIADKLVSNREIT